MLLHSQRARGSPHTVLAPSASCAVASKGPRKAAPGTRALTTLEYQRSMSALENTVASDRIGAGFRWRRLHRLRGPRHQETPQSFHSFCRNF